jgi:AcrR family transcriptional regulator
MVAAPASAPPAAREQLLETASQIMRDEDTVDVSLSELAARSGLNSALVKYYFGNKAGLMKALLERDFAGILKAVDTLLAKEADPETKLRLHMTAVVNTFFRTPYIHRLLMRLIRQEPPEVAQHLADTCLQPMLDAYARLIGEGVAAGVFRPVDPQFFYFTVIGAADRFSRRGWCCAIARAAMCWTKACVTDTAPISTTSSWRAFWCPMTDSATDCHNPRQGWMTRRWKEWIA